MTWTEKHVCTRNLACRSIEFEARWILTSGCIHTYACTYMCLNKRAKEKLISMHGDGDALVQNSIVDFKPLFMSFDFENKRDGTSTIDRGNQ